MARQYPILNKKNINMDVFKHVFLEPWKIL